jgi:tetratricopeptide (TPR) repeat protein
MMDLLSERVRTALVAANDRARPIMDRAEMLMEVAAGLQQQAPSMEYLALALQLYDRALALCPRSARILWARITARRVTTLRTIPGDDLIYLNAARESYRQVIPIFTEFGSPEEIAEAEMNYGQVLQVLAGVHRARIADAISAYQRAIRTFDRARFARQLAILHNSLATAFLSLPFTDPRGELREALAVQAFEDGLRIASLVDHPMEYAMLQHNLGNALQAASSNHTIEHRLRALDAYDEALRVWTRDTMPLEYASAIANKAKCLWNLPDEVERPGRGNVRRLHQALAYYREAREIFAAHGERKKVCAADHSCDQIERELLAAAGSAFAARVAQ